MDFGVQVVKHHPRASHVLVQMMHMFRGGYATTWPFDTNMFA
jgi:hypothetical protein